MHDRAQRFGRPPPGHLDAVVLEPEPLGQFGGGRHVALHQSPGGPLAAGDVVGEVGEPVYERPGQRQGGPTVEPGGQGDLQAAGAGQHLELAVQERQDLVDDRFGAAGLLALAREAAPHGSGVQVEFGAGRQHDHALVGGRPAGQGVRAVLVAQCARVGEGRRSGVQSLGDQPGVGGDARRGGALLVEHRSHPGGVGLDGRRFGVAVEDRVAAREHLEPVEHRLGSGEPRPQERGGDRRRVVIPGLQVDRPAQDRRPGPSGPGDGDRRPRVVGQQPAAQPQPPPVRDRLGVVGLGQQEPARPQQVPAVVGGRDQVLGEARFGPGLDRRPDVPADQRGQAVSVRRHGGSPRGRPAIGVVGVVPRTRASGSRLQPGR